MFSPNNPTKDALVARCHAQRRSVFGLDSSELLQLFEYSSLD